LSASDSIHIYFSFYSKENTPSIRSLESHLKEKLITWLSPAALELHQITWDDAASLLEKIVAYEVGFFFFLSFWLSSGTIFLSFV